MAHRHCLPNHYPRVPVLFLRDMHCKCCKSNKEQVSFVFLFCFFCFFDQITIVFFILSSFLCALTGRSGGCDCKLLNVQEGGVCNFSLVFPLYPSLTVLDGKNRLTFLLKII